MLAVVDTNVLVSSLWSRDGGPARVMALVLNGRLTLCYDHRILGEYRDVLLRPKFRFESWEVDSLLSYIEREGVSVVPHPLDAVIPDEGDRKFYETATHCNAPLITGNMRHYPPDGVAVTVADFLTRFAV